VAHTSGSFLKVSQHYIGNSSNIGYVLKGSPGEGINYTATDATHVPFNRANLRSPSWSPDGSKVVYEIPNWTQLPGETELFSYDPDWDYRYMDVFPQINSVTSRLATTQKVLGAANGSLVTSSPLYTAVVQALDSYDIYSVSNATEVLWLEEGQAGAFQPSWNPDGAELVVGFGAWFGARVEATAAIYRANVDGSMCSNLTDGLDNAGFPSWSPDGTAVVYRLWNHDTGCTAGPAGPQPHH
jgi:Tol biopolymer transport system component